VKSARPDESFNQYQGHRSIRHIDVGVDTNVAARSRHSCSYRRALAAVLIERHDENLSVEARRERCNSLLAIVTAVIYDDDLVGRHMLLERIGEDRH
jgi:hypothetical protein